MNIFTQFYKSIYSPKDIAIFRFQGIGKTILYVFFLTLISVLPSIIFFSQTLTSGLDSATSFIKDETPAFTIKNGQLSADTKVPITINKDHYTFILDPTGAVSVREVENEDNAIALLKDQFVVSSGDHTETYQYGMMQGMNITKKDLLHFIDSISSMRGIIIPVISVIIYLISSAANFIEISVLALIGLLLKKLTARNLNYRQLWRMATYSETLPTVFFAIMSLLKTSVPNSFLINWFVVIIVLLLAIKEVPKPKNQI
ncbi:DUF1189 domain-containing protein [Bacillus sp. BRMEA1]|uniref:DUF1189 domain-containing protein n=1 Tax=Neobacillus endophyticus TaxID=2738405 RepID=UPI001564C311|nr:DUF1189 domain-containing protein [Neobacillus endophyticus]NRD80771.1 DUF1189 domain-containing protein [Neobacillus endophyticus]